MEHWLTIGIEFKIKIGMWIDHGHPMLSQIFVNLESPFLDLLVRHVAEPDARKALLLKYAGDL